MTSAWQRNLSILLMSGPFSGYHGHKALADALGMDKPQAIYTWENGLYAPRKDRQEKLAELASQCSAGA